MNHNQRFINSIKSHTAVIGVVGLGYVGLPLSLRFAEAGFSVIGMDIDPEKPRKINAGQSYIKHFSDSAVQQAIEDGFVATTNFSRAKDCDC
jgi:UDP-N-acetyl-D-glucosamine dehydrogenase